MVVKVITASRATKAAFFSVIQWEGVAFTEAVDDWNEFLELLGFWAGI